MLPTTHVWRDSHFLIAPNGDISPDALDDVHRAADYVASISGVRFTWLIGGDPRAEIVIARNDQVTAAFKHLGIEGAAASSVTITDGQYGRISYLGPADGSSNDARATLHELLHSMGADHTTGSPHDTVMLPTIATSDPALASPQALDIEWLQKTFGASLDDDVIRAGHGSGSVTGGDGNDTLYGMKGNDILYGNTGNDVIYGGQGDDTLYGGTGDDTLSGDLGSDVIHGGQGNDTALLPEGSVFGEDGLWHKPDGGTVRLVDVEAWDWL